MASTFSTSLKLELIGDGDQSGIWGQTTNNNLGTLLEQAIAGVVTITMTDANYTLTNFNGVSDEARNMVLVATGVNAAVRDIIAPLVEKIYIVKNSTTGGYGVRIIGASGSGVTIPSGATVIVYCDATNFYAVNNESVNNFTVNGNLDVTGNVAITGTTAFTGVVTANVANATTSTITNLSSGNVTISGGAVTNLSNLSSANATITTLSNTNLSSSNVTITGGTISGITDLAIADGGTGASNAAAARTNLGLGTLATQSSVTAAQLPTGSVVQTQYAQRTTSTRVSGGSYADTGITVNITPTSASNKVLVKVCYSWSASDNTATYWRLVRNGTVIGAGADGASLILGQPSFVRGSIFSASFEFLDSPASTSAQTYKLQGYTPSGEWTINISQANEVLAGLTGTSSISTQEIVG